MSDSRTGVEIETSYSALYFVLGMCTPRIVIDGGPVALRPWGTSFFPLPPGRHRVEVYLRYLLAPKYGLAVADVEVRPGQVSRLSYQPASSVFTKGKLNELPPLAAAAHDAVGASAAPTPPTAVLPTIECKQANTAMILAVLSIPLFGLVGVVLGLIAISKARKAKKLIEADPNLMGAQKAKTAQTIATWVVAIWCGIFLLMGVAFLMNTLVD